MQDNQDRQYLIDRLCDTKIAYDKAKEDKRLAKLVLQRLQDGSTPIPVNLRDL